ncbi:MAG: hypothetical protein K9N06_04835 [Candidatus Cloacimonetes bacterium]|nr:hypothetical protein [Candidatus Cloacimonadota bacterium]
MMDFNYNDFLRFSTNSADLPQNFFRYLRWDRRKYNVLEEKHKKTGISIETAFSELRKRTGVEYNDKVYPAQTNTQSYSERIFPSYRFILPEVLIDDWLSIVDFHKDFSRDHAVHQPLTAYIVYKLLGGGNYGESFDINGTSLLEHCVDQILKSPKMEYFRNYVNNMNNDFPSERDLFDNDNVLNRELWKMLFFETAYVAALFHDIGYPWQYINRLKHCLSSADFSPTNTISNSKSVYEMYKNRLIFYPFNGYRALSNDVPCNWQEEQNNMISTSIAKTHGFSGALGYLYLNDIIREYPALENLSLSQLCVEWAALGILMHDMKSVYLGNKEYQPEYNQLRLEFDQDPLSCIITLSDLIEEFERPNLVNTPHRYSSNFRYECQCASTEITLNVNTLNIAYNYNNTNALANKLRFINKDQEEYFNRMFGYINLSCIGIERVILSATII